MFCLIYQEEGCNQFLFSIVLCGAEGRIGKTADNNLRIDNARLHDSGNYHVVLRNMFGMISADITLDVYCK